MQYGFSVDEKTFITAHGFSRNTSMYGVVYPVAKEGNTSRLRAMWKKCMRSHCESEEACSNISL